MKLLLVEDSRSVSVFLEGLLRDEADFELLPVARTGSEGVEAAQRWRPELVLMDLGLPEMDGLEAISEIMATVPCPIVVLSGQLCAPGRDRTFEALQAGAVEVLAKPAGLDAESVRGFRERLLRTVRVMSQARVVGRRRQLVRVAAVPTGEGARPAKVRCGLVAIGGSTGAPLLVYELLKGLRGPVPFPVVVAQHIVPGFEQGFARWLEGAGHPTVVAAGGERLEAGRVYVAPADRDLAVRGEWLEVLPARGSVVPSVDVLFESVARSQGARAVGLLLTGMGSDGARGLLAMRRAGSLTVTQDGASCVVDSMPSTGRALGGSCRVLTPGEMGVLLGALARGEEVPDCPAIDNNPSPAGRGTG